jgi:hypothetical protein
MRSFLALSAMNYVIEYKLLPLLLIKHIKNRYVFAMSEHQEK